MQHVLRRRRDEINMQCDALLAEIENKRSYFLADLEYEERIHQSNLEESIKRLEKVLGASQGLQSYTNDVISSDKVPFLEVKRSEMSTPVCVCLSVRSFVHLAGRLPFVFLLNNYQSIC